MTNLFPGLARGPIDHEASSVINVIANEQIDMGDAVKLAAAGTNEILPRADQSDTALEDLYGVAVGGDADGIYGDGSASSDDTTRASLGAGEAIVVVTQGRALARVTGTISVGTKLEANGTAGLRPFTTGDIIATALQASTGSDIIAVDIQREGAT